MKAYIQISENGEAGNNKQFNQAVCIILTFTLIQSNSISI